MRRLLAMIAAMMLVTVLPGTAVGHDSNDTSQPSFEKKTDNVSFVAHHKYDLGTDMQFQRRHGDQTVDGRQLDLGPGQFRDFLFAGADSSTSGGDGAIEIFDVTDPTDPQHLTSIECDGYHTDVAVYENLLVQSIDAGNSGCLSQGGLPGYAGVRIWDVTDPANPTVLKDVREARNAHNITVVPWAGLLYVANSDLASQDVDLTIVDLKDPDFPVTVIEDARSFMPAGTSGCHDIGLDPKRELAFCAAITQTVIWDISDPFAPTHVSTIVNPDDSLHHGARLAPDGTTLVLNDELAGAAAAFGCQGTGSAGAVGALWFYDVSTPQAPVPMGSFSPTERSPTKAPCTSHFYNFIPGTTYVVTGWYKAGVIVTDYSTLPAPEEHAVFLPEGANFWSGYYWRGYLYGNSFGSGGGQGLWVAKLDGVGDTAPSPYDEGTSWAMWTTGDHTDAQRPASTDGAASGLFGGAYNLLPGL